MRRRAIGPSGCERWKIINIFVIARKEVGKSFGNCEGNCRKHRELSVVVFVSESACDDQKIRTDIPQTCSHSELTLTQISEESLLIKRPSKTILIVSSDSSCRMAMNSEAESKKLEIFAPTFHLSNEISSSAASINETKSTVTSTTIWNYSSTAQSSHQRPVFIAQRELPLIAPLFVDTSPHDQFTWCSISLSRVPRKLFLANRFWKKLFSHRGKSEKLTGE